MEERTRAYLRGRFRDYYRRASLIEPPAADRREWGYIPWSSGSTTMVRHQSLLELGDLNGFLAERRPRHVYYSSGRYRDPGADDMAEKGWQGSDLIFDLDADHLPGVDPDADSHAEMLAACKEELWRLLETLREDFAFDDVSIAFSGGRGYHVHVRDEAVLGLDRGARREIVDYVRGIGVDFEGLVRTAQSGTATRREIDVGGGWGRRVHVDLLAFVDEIAEMDESDALERLHEFDGIGEKRARTILGAIREHRDALERGVVEVGGTGLRTLVSELTDETVRWQSAAIDEPVTTDTHRLIRLPGSLHGGTGLRVTPIALEELDAFDPLADALPDAFRGHEIAVRGDGGPPVELGGETFTVPADVVRVPEYVGLFLMARGRAEKEKE